MFSRLFRKLAVFLGFTITKPRKSSVQKSRIRESDLYKISEAKKEANKAFKRYN